MKISQEFTVDRPLPDVWAFFQDIPEVAACLPGAEYLGPKGDGRHAGKVSSRIGPFQASFEGEAEVVYNDADKTIHVDGKGVDKKGASRSKMVMNCSLESVGTATRVVVRADIQLSGTIAQFGRTGLITEIAKVLVADFVRNAEAELLPPASVAAAPEAAMAASPAAPARPISALALFMVALKSWLLSLFARRPA
jgi:carbon monoxide dehydrogenase subunit G